MVGMQGLRFAGTGVFQGGNAHVAQGFSQGAHLLSLGIKVSKAFLCKCSFNILYDTFGKLHR